MPSFSVLFQENYSDLLAEAKRYVRQSEDAEDLVGNVFERAQGYKRAIGRAYLFKMVQNAGKDFWRRSKRVRFLSLDTVDGRVY